MGNSFKLSKWIIIGVVVLVVISIGAFVLLNSNNFFSKNGDKLELMHSDELNNKLEPYKGAMNGSKVRQLINILYDNAVKNDGNAGMLPDLAYQLNNKGNFTVINSTSDKSNASEIKSIALKFENNHVYFVEFVYNKAKTISGVIIKNNEDEVYELKPDQS